MRPISGDMQVPAKINRRHTDFISDSTGMNITRKQIADSNNYGMYQCANILLGSWTAKIDSFQIDPTAIKA